MATYYIYVQDGNNNCNHVHSMQSRTTDTANQKDVPHNCRLHIKDGNMFSENYKVHTYQHKNWFVDNISFPGSSDLDDNSKIDKFEVIFYQLQKQNKYNSEIDCYKDALETLEYFAKNDQECKELLPKYKKILKEKIERNEYCKKTDGYFSKVMRNAGFDSLADFLRDDWTGEKVRKFGLEKTADWLEDKDKVCTDGCDDGKIGFWEGTKSLVKGLVGGIPKMVINHPLTTAVMAGVGAGAVALTGGAILPVLGTIGVVTGVGMAGYGGYKAATAKTDGEAKQALETLGTGITTTALSMASAGKALEKAAEAGVKSAEISKDANIFQKTWQMFKSIPESWTKSKEWARFNLDIPTTKEVDMLGRTTKKTYSENAYREYHYEYSYDKNCERLVNKTAPNGDYKLYDWIDHNVIEEGSLTKGTYKKYYCSGKSKEVGNTKTGEYIKYSLEGKVEETGNIKTGEYTKFNFCGEETERISINGVNKNYYRHGDLRETRNTETGDYTKYDVFGRLEEEGNTFTKTYKKWTSSNRYEKYENGKYKGNYDKYGNRLKDADDYINDFFKYYEEYTRSTRGSATGSASAEKVTLKDGAEKFVNFVNSKVAGGSSMSESEMKDFAKLTGFSYEQIANMDRNTYRQLCIKYHPDRNPNNPLAEKIFEIIQNIYKFKKAA